MKTAIDSSVLLDFLTDSPNHAENSQRALNTARQNGALIVCETVIAEISPVLPGNLLDEFMKDLGISFIASTYKSAKLAGEMFSTYLKRKGDKKRVVADFLIGSHAQVHGNQLLARDRGFFRDYFSDLKIFYPEEL